MLQVLCLVALLCLLSYVKLKYFKSRRERMIMKVPGPHYHWLFGNTFQIKVSREERYAMFLNIFRQFPESSMVRLWVGVTPFVFLTKADTVEEVLGSNSLLNKGVRYQDLIPWLGEGLLISEGKKWKTRRRMLTPAFHFGILEKFLVTINEHAVVLMNLLKQKASQSQQPFDFYPFSTRCTLDIICETAMGSTARAQHEGDNEYVKAVCNLAEMSIYRFHRPWLRYNALFNLTKTGKEFRKCLDTVHGFTNRVIEMRKNEYVAMKGDRKWEEEPKEEEEVYGKKKRLAFLDLLLQRHFENGDIDEQGIREEVDTFMFEGHDTTASAISWAVYNIGRYPDVQTKVQQELVTVLGEEEVEGVASAQLNQCKYLECVIKESMRMFPPVPFYSRQMVNDVTIGGLDIPAGTVVAIATKAIHSDPQHFPRPQEFEPERFLAEKDSGRHPYSFLPFSAGPRNCIGQRFAMLEIKTVLAHLFHRYTVRALSSLPSDTSAIAELILRPVDGHSITLSPRAH